MSPFSSPGSIPESWSGSGATSSDSLRISTVFGLTERLEVADVTPTGRPVGRRLYKKV